MMRHTVHAQTKAIACPPDLQPLALWLYGDARRTRMTFATAFALIATGLWIAGMASQTLPSACSL